MTAPGGLLQTRRSFDRRILDAMRGPDLEVVAYRSARDMATGLNPLTPGSEDVAVGYVVTIRQPTLVSASTWRPATVVTINADVPGFPVSEPAVYAVERPVPWSPHWHSTTGRFCMGDFWSAHQGRALLGDLVTHIARLLNWDEKLRPGYLGWNSAAVAQYWARQGAPLVEGVEYPVVPAALITGTARPAFVPRVKAPTASFTLRAP